MSLSLILACLWAIVANVLAMTPMARGWVFWCWRGAVPCCAGR